MSASKIKGCLLEFIVRRLLENCGFTRVRPDGVLIFNKSGLTMINGKGAAHDADVLMDPPIQMPFSYPFRLNFECKAYNKKTDLSIIRNALGLRYDINEFEIVTRDLLMSRKNNRRSSLALDNRQRFNYQIGVASVEGFSKPAFEFAANNKIPLLSLRWFLPEDTCDMFHQVTNAYMDRFNQQEIQGLIQFLQGNENHIGLNFITETDSIIRDIYRSFIEFEKSLLVGLLESGDLLFLIDENRNVAEVLSSNKVTYSAQFHYLRRQRDYWQLSADDNLEFGFYLPENIVEMWKSQNFDKQAAIGIKENVFSKVFVFTKNGEIPFRIFKIDREWLNQIGTNE